MAFAVCCGLHWIALLCVAMDLSTPSHDWRCARLHARALQWSQSTSGHDSIGGIFVFTFFSFPFSFSHVVWHRLLVSRWAAW
ncbi:hypothetical protein CGRA01v4_00927 [Colletotrichum graminicola]|nr:hypothetical protein CGRA01v4_00927 [Colletotrichum graminicola]